MAVTPRHILEFWFSERIKPHWFDSTPVLDAEIRASYEALWKEAAEGGLDHWCASPDGCLALVIVLDQFPLNMFRGEALSFSTEARAIDVARQAIAKGFDKQIPQARLAFLYMPFMHSENLDDQSLSVKLFTDAGLEDNIRFAQHHYDIVQRFGRFPHRNAILGRDSTTQELAYLSSKQAYKG